MAKDIGSPRSRREVRAATKRVLKLTKHLTPTEAARFLSLHVDDIRNMRQGVQAKPGGGLLSVAMVLKMVKVGRYDPASILVQAPLRHIPSGKSTRGARQDLVNRRIAKLARLRPGKETAKLTGLSVTGAYGLRYAPDDANVTLYTLLGFWHAGHDLDSMIFGG